MKVHFPEQRIQRINEKVRKKGFRLNNDLKNVLNPEVKWKKIFCISVHDRHNPSVAPYHHLFPPNLEKLLLL